MSFASIDVQSRPIKIAYLVEYNDKVALKKALEINSVLWGNRFNSIIPVYKRIPKNFSDEVRRKYDDRTSVIKGYLDAFDPDYIINLTNEADDSFPVSPWRFISEEDMFSDSGIMEKKEGGIEISYGVSLFEILDYLENKEFKYKRNEPFPITIVNYSKRNEIFLGTIFGFYNDYTTKVLLERYKPTINLSEDKATLNNYLDFLKEKTPVKSIGNDYITTYRNRGPGDNYIFFMDANSWQDNVDLFNLRATDVRVMPIPTQIASSPQVVSICEEYIIKNYRKYNDNNVYFHTNILKSRDSQKTSFDAFVSSIKVEQKPHEWKFTVQEWYPRMWDASYRERDGAASPRLENKKISTQADGSDTVRVPIVYPELLGENIRATEPRFANEIIVKAYGAKNHLANVFPSIIEHPDILIGQHGIEHWRFSGSRIVHFPRYERDAISFKIPTAEKVFTEWQNALGIKAHTSNPGRLAQQIVQKLGADHLNILANEGFAKLLQNATGAKASITPISYDKLRAEIHKSLQGSQWFDTDGYLQWILHQGVLELGTTIECSNCNRSSWHKLKDLSLKVDCNICQQEINVGLADPKKQLEWAYRPLGPFTVPDLSQGAYTVVLSLNFFSHVMHMDITPRYSFESEDGEYEADFGILTKQHWADGGGTLQLLGECKSFGYKNKPQFQASDVSKLIKLSKKYDNTVLVFATLNTSLNASDKVRLKKLVEQLREKRFKTGINTDVLILTGNELFTFMSLEMKWKKIGGRHKSFADQIHRGRGIKELCDITQQLYLDTESFWDWLKKRDKRFADQEPVKVVSSESPDSSN